jgi:hypothetical protein
MPTLAGQMQTATAGTAAGLTGGVTATGAPQTALLNALTAITDGTFAIAVNGVVQVVGPTDFTGMASLAACAARIDLAMPDCSCAWSTDHFVITTHATGPAATLSYASSEPPHTDISTLCKLTSAQGASLAQGSQSLNPQWVPCRGQYIRVKTPFGTPRPVAGMLYSTGTTRDYWMRVGRWGGAHGITPYPDTLRVPWDPSSTYFCSTADDSSETTLVNPYTVQRPPPGVK